MAPYFVTHTIWQFSNKSHCYLGIGDDGTFRSQGLGVNAGDVSIVAIFRVKWKSDKQHKPSLFQKLKSAIL